MMSEALFDLVDAKDTFSDSDWFHRCRETQRPYVVVRTGEVSADVLWDYVTLPPQCDEIVQRHFLEIRRCAHAIFDRFAIPESYIRIKPTLICFDHLPFDHAKRAAAELYRLIATYLPKTWKHPPEAAGERWRADWPNGGATEREVRPNGLRLWIEQADTSNAA